MSVNGLKLGKSVSRSDLALDADHSLAQGSWIFRSPNRPPTFRGTLIRRQRTTTNLKAGKAASVFWPPFPLYARAFFPVVRHFFLNQKPGDHPNFRKNALGVKGPFSELSESSGVFSEQLSELEIPFSEYEIPFSEWPLTT